MASGKMAQVESTEAAGNVVKTVAVLRTIRSIKGNPQNNTTTGIHKSMLMKDMTAAAKRNLIKKFRGILRMKSEQLELTQANKEKKLNN